MKISEIQTIIGNIENNALLYEDKHFLRRIDTIDFLEFQIARVLEKPQNENFVQLKNRIGNVISALEKINDNFFHILLENIRKEKIKGIEFKSLINEYFDFDLYYNEYREEVSYDYLDVFIDRLFPQQAMPEQTTDLEQGMVYYQKTPARIVFEFMDKINFSKDDVFFDLGSGLGQVTILVNLLSDITTNGVEIEPSFYDYAKQCATKLNLLDVNFINEDARKVDYSKGTIFFMFTPFTGKILEDVLWILKEQSQQRNIKIITYGPCTKYVASQSWLEFMEPQILDIHKIAIFKST